MLICWSFLAFTASAPAQQGWARIWHDEFNQANGSTPDYTKWGYDTGAGGWGNNELQCYTSRTNNARIENGSLIIEAHQEDFAGSSYTSARLLTKAKWSWTYVRVEGRIKVPKGQGIWPAFWMLGADIDSAGWPACGEIDIMENIGREPGIVHGTIHGPGYSGGNSVGGSYSLPTNSFFSDDYHVYSIEWATNCIRWFVDGLPYFTATPTNLPSGAQWVFSKPKFLLLNVAVGGNWPGNPDAKTVFPQRMLVDYIRVYAVKNPAEKIDQSGPEGPPRTIEAACVLPGSSPERFDLSANLFFPSSLDSRYQKRCENDLMTEHDRFQSKFWVPLH